MMSLIGTYLGKYQILEEIGRGGMAQVYKAHQPSLNRFVAIKVLHSYLMDGQSLLERFQREARAAASLRHPNIVQVFDFDVQENVYYMVMEYIEGMTLKDKLVNILNSGSCLSFEQSLNIFNQVANALGYAHDKGMVHRDIKPSNILIDLEDTAYLSDFGIARIVSEKQITLTGALIGTPEYMSPEQALGQHLTPASDIYSLAITLFEIFTCKVPFSAATPMSVMQKHINQPPPPLRDFRPDAPQALEAVLQKALAKDPETRYQDVSAFQIAVQQACQFPVHGQTIIETQDTSYTSTIVEPIQAFHRHAETIKPPVETTINQQRIQPKKKNQFLLWGGMAIIVLLIGSFLAGIFSGALKLPNFTTGDRPEQTLPVVALIDTPTRTKLELATKTPLETTPPIIEEPTQTSIPPTRRPTWTSIPKATNTNALTATSEKPSLTLDQNYYCRQRPNSTSEEHWVLLSGLTVNLLGKSSNNWWLVAVDDPATRTKCCWVGGGQPHGDLTILPLITYEIDRLNCPTAP